MTHAGVHIRFAGADLVLDPSGALYYPDQDAIIVADLHFEKGRSVGLRTRRPLPPYDTMETLRRLSTVVAIYNPKTVLCLGDSFHDHSSIRRFMGDGQAEIDILLADRRWIWILGNHDPHLPPNLGGETVSSLNMGALLFQHDNIPHNGGAVIGHFHPVALAAVGGRVHRRRCFVANTDILILPSFGAYTGGLNILHPDLKSVIGLRFNVWLIGSTGVYPIATSKLLKEQPHPSLRI